MLFLLVMCMKKIWNTFFGVRHMKIVHRKNNWKMILEDHPDQQVSIAKVAQKRMKYRQKLLEIDVAGLTL